MTGELNLYVRDLYPNFGTIDTGEQTQPDPEDKKALVDDQEIARNVEGTGSANKSRVFGAIALIFGIAFIAGVISK